MNDDEIVKKFQGFHKRIQQIESVRGDTKLKIENVIYTISELNRSYDRSFENLNNHVRFLTQLIQSKDRQINLLFEEISKLKVK